MTSDLIARAARERAQQYAARADRPRQRRCAEDAASRASVRTSARIDFRAASGDDGPWDFHGVASATEIGYPMWDWAGEYTEIVDAGAFDDTLSRADLDVPLVLAHDSLRRIARTTTGTLALSMSDEGLVVDAPNLDPRDADVAYIAPKLRAGLIDEMSFMFRIDSGQWSPDYSEFRITRVDIHRGDVAIVGYGANPYTSGELRAVAPNDIRRALLSAAIAVRP